MRLITIKFLGESTDSPGTCVDNIFLDIKLKAPSRKVKEKKTLKVLFITREEQVR